MGEISITVDGEAVRARKGDTILRTALDNGIYVPNLCAVHDARRPFAACRLCFVGVRGREHPVCACTEETAEGMVVNTRDEGALRLARTSFELIMFSHRSGCASCPGSGSCELQRIAKHLGVGLRAGRFRGMAPDRPVDGSNPFLTYDPDRCVLCGRCVWVCSCRLGRGILGFVNRGFSRVVSVGVDESAVRSACKDCGECVKVCPTGALTDLPRTFPSR